jgi:periplasmic divalent cation tolerance protein
MDAECYSSFSAFPQTSISLVSGLGLAKYRSMKHTSQHVVVLVTAPDVKSAKALASAALEVRLAACVNVIPKIQSFFWWEGKLQKADEAQMVFKTTLAKIEELEKLVVDKHSYDTPEFLVLPASGGNSQYLEWLNASVRPVEDAAK